MLVDPCTTYVILVKKKKKISASFLVCSLLGFVCVCLQELKLYFPLSLYMVSEPGVAKEL